MHKHDKAAIGLWLASRLSEAVGDRPISPSDLIQTDLGLDSLDSVELVMAIEEEFGISVPDTDWEGGSDRTVTAVVELIHTKLEAKGVAHVRR